MKWRVIITDSEGETGVAPVCPSHNDSHVYIDCCPLPHIECWNRYTAVELVELLNATDAELCS